MCHFDTAWRRVVQVLQCTARSHCYFWGEECISLLCVVLTSPTCHVVRLGAAGT